MRLARTVERAAFTWGQWVGRYSLYAMRPERMVVSGFHHMGDHSPCIYVGWHQTNLAALAFHRHLWDRPCFTFVPPGLEGAVVRGWMTVYHQTPALLPPDGIGNPQAALKQMARALRSGIDAVVALDGPHGPAERVRPGALWLARLTGRPLVPAGFAARPSFHYPRWDRHLVPLPGAVLSVIVGEPLAMARDEPVDEAHLTALAERVHTLNHLAREQLRRLPAAPSVPQEPT